MWASAGAPEKLPRRTHVPVAAVSFLLGSKQVNHPTPHIRTGGGRRRLRVALISQPWSTLARPSPAIGALTAYLRARAPEVDVTPRHDYVHVAHAIGPSLYELVAEHAYRVGELLYAASLYPAKRSDVVAFCARELARVTERPASAISAHCTSWEQLIDRTIDVLAAATARLVDQTAEDHDLIGLSTSFGQVFANLALARQVKDRAPRCAIVLGGSSVSHRVGPSLLSEYPFVDYIVQGEGERPLAALVAGLAQGDLPMSPIPGVLGRGWRPDGARSGSSEVEQLDELPDPDYDEYAGLAAEYQVSWTVSIEGSRGCWWDRVHAAGNPRATCFFCNLNVQWSGFREKTPKRVVAELSRQSDRYRTTRFFFVDNIQRHRDLDELSGGLSSLGRDLAFFTELRANARPGDIVKLWEAGLEIAQVGIEGLSTRYLARIGKGTSTILNLQAMKTLAELGIRNESNLIVDFPGSIQADVDETVRNILDFAITYQPLSPTRFHLGLGSTVATQPEDFSVSAIRNADFYRNALPEDVWRRIHLLDLSFDCSAVADWSPVEAACAAWTEAHANRGGEHLLEYRDGGTFLRITDRRRQRDQIGNRRRQTDITLTGRGRSLYLFCMQIRSIKDVLGKFSGHGDFDASACEAFVGAMVERKLMFREGAKVLSLALAATPRAAASRIRAMQLEQAAVRAPLRLETADRLALPVVV